MYHPNSHLNAMMEGESIHCLSSEKPLVKEVIYIYISQPKLKLLFICQMF